MSLTDTEARRASTRPVEATAPPELVVLTVGAVVLGLALRFVTRSALWLDEALSVNIATQPLGDIVDALRHDGHPPLYYVLLHGWTNLFGTGHVAVRALSGVFAVLTLPFAWLAGHRRGGPVLAWLTLLVLALAPFGLRYATETRMYSLVMLLVLVGWLLIDDAVGRGRADAWRVGAIAVVTAALLYTHYWAMWLLAATLLVVGWQAWRAASEDVRRGARRALVGLVVGAALFVPWLPVLADQAAHTGTPWAGPQRPTSVIATTLTDFGGGDFRDAELVGGILLLLMLLAVFGRARDAWHIDLDLRTRPLFRHDALVLVLTLGIGALVSYATWSAYATRYSAVVFPIAMLLVAGGIACFTGRWARDGVALVVTLAFVMGAVFNVTGERTQAKEIAAVVAAEAQPGDVVVYCPDQLGPAGLRVMPAGLVQLSYPTLGDPARVDWRDYEKRNAAADPAALADAVLARAGDDHRIFVVWSGTYATFEGQCEQFVDALSTARGGASTPVGEDGRTYFEHAQLTVVPAAS